MPQTVANSTAVERALSLYDLLLFTAKKYSAADFIKLLNCSKSTVSRLLQQVDKRQGMKLNRDIQGGREWYSLDMPARRPRILCSSDEMKALSKALAKADLSKPEAAKMQNLVRRLSMLCTDNDTAITSAVNPVSKSWVDLTGSARTISRLSRAIINKTVCTLFWKRRTGSLLSWRMAPVKLFASADSVYAAGWHVPGALRDKTITQEILEKQGALQPCIIYVHHLAKVESTDQAYSLPEELPVTSHFGFAGSGSPFRLHVRFSRLVADYVEERHYSDDEVKTPHEDGSLELECTASSRAEVLTWLLGFGSCAKLIEPSDLIPRLKKELASCASLYADDKNDAADDPAGVQE